MLNKKLFPAYTPREKEQEKVKNALYFVQETGSSKVLLLYGVGGTGKTYFVRNLPNVLSVARVRWMGPIDLDDVEFWSLINLKSDVAQKLGVDYFEDYFEFLSRYNKKEAFSEKDKRVFQTRENEIFLNAYKKIFEDGKEIPVLIIDTIEAVRGISVAKSLINWLVQLPFTLIILSGRPQTNTEEDIFVKYLTQYPQINFEKITLSGFTLEESLLYLQASGVYSGLIGRPEVLDKLVLLSRGHPLWLALIVYYLQKEGIPRELSKYTANELQALSENSIEFDSFIREMLVPYRQRDFWHEAILRLSILRQRMSKDIWVQVMEDMPFPKGIDDWDTAWKIFLTFPWIRERANQQYITLHDAFSEELAKRYISQADMSDEWRIELWQKAAEAYRILINTQGTLLQETGGNAVREVSQRLSQSLEKEVFLSETYLRQIVYLHYQMLADYECGIIFFEDLTKIAIGKKQFLLAEFLALEIQRFLPRYNLVSLEDIENKRAKEIADCLEKDTENLKKLCNALAELNLYLRRFDNTVTIFNEVFKYFKGNPEYQVEILVWLFTGTWRSNLDGGIAYLYDAIEIIQETPNLSKKMAEIQYLIGFSYRAKYQLDTAKDWLEKARKTSQEQRQPDILAKSLNILGYIYRVIGDTRKAIPTVHEAIVLQQHLLNKMTEDSPEHREAKIYLAWSYNTLGEINRYRGKLSSAQSYYEKAGLLFSEAQDYEGEAIALQALGDTRRRIALAVQRRGDFEKSERYWKKSENSIRESLRLYKEYNLDRGLESAYRRYGRFLHVRGSHDGAKENFQDGLEEAKRKDNLWEMIENAQELAFLAAEKGDAKEFSLWENKVKSWLNNENQKSYEQVKQWKVFCPLLEIARGCLFFSQGEYVEALSAYMDGFTKLAGMGGYGAALYGEHRARLFKDLEKLPDVKMQKEWLRLIKQSWENKGLEAEFPRLITLCEARLITIDVFGDFDNE